MDDLERMKELKDQGFYCSQILLMLGMDLQGKRDPDLVRAMQGLAGGLGFSGELCGALSGGACLLGLYAGKGLPEEEENPRLNFMIEDLVAWFKATYGQKYGDIRCATILEQEINSRTPPCAGIVAATLQKVKELLVANGFDLAGSDF
jgi:C_GCAxxG_C_C family probable redox protein